MGLLDKGYLRFPEQFWERDVEFIGYVTEHWGEWTEIMNYVPVVNEPVLMIFHSGSTALRLEQQTDAQITSAGMDVLRRMYGATIPEPESVKITRWASDPFTLGSYSYRPVGALPRHHDDLAAPVSNRLFFAGEATHRRLSATVHGAYLSGVRAAREVLDSV
jgi:monoamine oxidase